MSEAKSREFLDKQLNEIPALKTITESDKKYKDWKECTLSIIRSIFGEESENYKRVYQHFFPQYMPSIGSNNTNYHAVYLRGLDFMDSLLSAFIVEIKMRESDTEECKDAINLVKDICTRFHQVAKQIRRRYNNRPTLDIEDEYDVQNLLHALLRLYFDDVRAEEWTPSYAGNASRMDFLLKQEQIVIEVKKTRKGLHAKEIGEELIIDIVKYKKHQDCKTLICFVYDPEGRVANPTGMENDLNSETENLKVITIITPK